MAYELRPNSGSLHRNDRQREGKKDPNAQGRLLLSRDLIEALFKAGGDQVVWVSAWTKTSQNGKAWQSLSVREPQSDFERGDQNSGALPRTQQRQADPNDFDDDIPF